MAAGQPLQSFSQRSLPVTLEGANSVIVKVVAGDPVYYSTLGEYVTPTSNQGSIANGGSQTFTEGVWLRSAGSSSVTVDYGSPPADAVNPELQANKDQPNGYAGLDAGGLLKAAELPAATVASVFGRTGAIVAASGDYTVAQVTGAAPQASPTFTGTTTAPEFSASGLTGATAASRYVGGTASGAPASGTFAVGDWVVDQTGKRFTCTVAGSPGTWVQEPGSTTAPVSSVFTRTGAVVAASGDYTAAQVTNAADKSSGSQQAFTAEVAAPDFKPSGLTGATAASRYAGATASGAPASGTFAVGDHIVAQNGHVFVCTGAGTPGTWVDAGSVGNLVTSVFGRTGVVAATSGDYTAAQVTNAADKSSGSQQNFTGEVKAPDLVAGGLTGATAASRYVGATASTAPASGTFAVGDFVVDQTGRIWICTSAGTPGTWTQVSSLDYKVLLATQAKGTVSNGTFVMSAGQAAVGAAAPGTAANALLFYLASTDYATGAVLNVRAAHANGATALTMTTTVGLYPMTLSAGNYVIGTVVAGSTIAIASPAANTITQASSGDFTLPSNGLYALGYATSGAPGAATWDLAAQLRVKP